MFCLANSASSSTTSLISTISVDCLISRGCISKASDNFSFKLIAESEEDSDAAKAIERTFRKFLYPKRAGSIALAYPPLFEISFYKGEVINQYMPNIKPCYLTSLESTFNETANTFHSDGSPIEVNLSLGFQEERALLRDDLYANDDAIDESPGFSSITTAQTVKGDD